MSNSLFDRNNYMTVEALEDGVTVAFSRNVQYRKDKQWMLLKSNMIVTLYNNELCSFKCNLLKGEVLGIIKINGSCNLIGNCLSLIFGDDARYTTDISGYVDVFSTMFMNCFGIKNISSDFLPATTLADRCYDRMFSDCISLTTAPVLPATTLAKGCYNRMFNRCDSLTTAPELPATTLVDSCYSSMFGDCTSLTTAPELLATTLVDSCYSNMFKNCSKLNYIKMLATNISADDCLYFWVNGVASTGTFVKNPEATWDVIGVNGVPFGWTVKFDGEEDANLITFTIEGVEYQAEEGMTWEEWLDSPYNVNGYYAALYSIPEMEIVGFGITLNGRDFISSCPNNKLLIIARNAYLTLEKYYLVTI